jgi:hypothetical protein
MRQMKMHIKFYAENLKGRDHREDLGVLGRKTLKSEMDLEKRPGVWVWTVFSWLRIQSNGGLL